MAQQLGSGDAADGYTINGDLTVAGQVVASGTASQVVNIEIDGTLQHDGTKAGFYGASPVAVNGGSTTTHTYQYSSNLSTLTTLASFGTADATAFNQVVASLGAVIGTLQALGIWNVSG